METEARSPDFPFAPSGWPAPEPQEVLQLSLGDCLPCAHEAPRKPIVFPHAGLTKESKWDCIPTA